MRRVTQRESGRVREIKEPLDYTANRTSFATDVDVPSARHTRSTRAPPPGGPRSLGENMAENMLRRFEFQSDPGGRSVNRGLQLRSRSAGGRPSWFLLRESLRFPNFVRLLKIHSTYTDIFGECVEYWVWEISFLLISIFRSGTVTHFR